MANSGVLPAATVLLLRDTPAGIEVLMTRRSASASFAPGAYVFPGGGIDAADFGGADVAGLGVVHRVETLGIGVAAGIDDAFWSMKAL